MNKNFYCHKNIFSVTNLLVCLLILVSLNTQAQVLLTQSFDVNPFPPSGWTNLKVAGTSLPGTWNRSTSGTNPSEGPHSGAGQARYNSYNYLAGTSGEFSTTAVNFTVSGSNIVTFWMYRDNSYAAAFDKLEVYVNTSQASSGGTLLGTINRNLTLSPVEASNGWYQYTFTVPGIYNGATNYIIFRATSGFGSNMYVDDITITHLAPAPPGCVSSFSPNTGATGICTNSSIIWSTVATATGYKISIGSNSPNYNNIASNVDLGGALSYSLPLLSATTTYGWKVTPYNTFGDATGCISNTFTTGAGVCYCTPTYTETSCSSEDYIDDFSTTGGATNITNIATGCSANPNNYTYYSTKTVTAVQGASFTVTMAPGPDFSEGFGIWADWNHDGDFSDAGEFIYSSPATSPDETTGTITVPYTALTGSTRLRVRNEFETIPTSSESCLNYEDGETEDYNISVTACTPITWYADADADTYGNQLLSQSSCPQPLGYIVNNTDCNDANAAVHPGVIEVCNGIDDDCVGGADNGLTFINYYTDGDADTYGTGTAVNSCSPIAGKVTNNTDCNDANAAVHPGVIEVCNGIDDDCVGGVDNGLTFIDYYTDADADSYGTGTAVNSCSPIAGKVTNNTDCNDANAAVHPGAVEVCNGLDDDCDGGIDNGLTFIDYYTDADADSYGTGTAVNSCSPIAGKVTNNTDCNDANAAVHPGAVEVCNGLDDDCDGGIDNGLTFIDYYTDADADSYGTGTAVNSCSPIAGKVTNNTDCNDANAAVHPGAVEVCNGIDDDCVGGADNGLFNTTITPSGTVSVCQGSSVLLQVVTGQGTYQWYKAGVIISGATTASYNATATGNYTVKITSGACNATSVATVVNIVVSPKAKITVSGNLDICLTGSVLLKANSGTGFTYQWSKNGSPIAGATAKNYTATSIGSYAVKITNASGCYKTSAAKVVTTSCRLIDETSAGILTIYPNPTSDMFTVNLNTGNDSNKEAIVSVYTILGDIVYTSSTQIVNGELEEQIHLMSSIPSAIYIVKVGTDTNEYISRVVIEK